MVAIITKTVLILAILVVFAFAGFLLGKSKKVTSANLPALANILLYLCQPMLTLKAFAIDPIAPHSGLLWNFLWVALFALASVVVVFFLAELVFSFVKEKSKRNVLVFVSTFSNCTFVGLPFVEMFTGGDREAMMYIIVFGVVFNMLFWTLGAYLISGDKKQISVRHALLNPNTIGAAVGFFFFLVPQANFFHMDAVRELQQIVVYTGDMTAPISMLVVGVRLSELSPRTVFCDPKLYLASAMRLVGGFAVSYLIMLPFRAAGLFAASPYVLMGPVIAMSMPPAAGLSAFAETFDREKEYSAAAFSLGTLLSCFTLPVVMLLVTL